MASHDDELSQIDGAINAVSDAATSVREWLSEDVDRFLQDALNQAWSSPVEQRRRKYAMIAANITEDRYSAGSTAARMATIILLTDGPKAVVDFIADLQHHES